jgi:eukaryotic-like serine/threonine-protein kinase
MPPDPARVKSLFQAALDLPDPAGRPAFLDRECGGDRELRGRLDALLSAHDRPASALERPLAAPDEPATDADLTTDHSDPTASYRPAPASPIIGTVVAGRYKVRQEIGEGGMGTVFLAEQTQPVKRQVALKLIKPGMDSRTVLARFESERQALALMDHPNIAKVLDAGTTEQGRPFFVMELVKGIPLTDYCDQHRLGLPERLNLFRQICSAVQHAHQKGIIHRDLKPSNILVESHDEKPVPKVIDFGLAKATSGMQLSEHSLYSAFGSVAGTPLYMAPEQATFNAIDVDTRADIYSLGVILYELLTGSTPIQRATMKKAALDEMLRMIREVEPPTPSSRIGSSDTLPSLAASRHIEPARLGRFVRGDLDWIVMKALAKERHRRYDSAIGLANDIERFTNHEPVSAGPPTAAYRMRKFVRRNRGKVVAASLVLLALVGGIIGTTLGLVEARRQRGIALAQEKEAQHQRGIAVAQEKETRRRLGQRDKANEILLSIFANLNPRGGDKATLPLSDRLGRNLDLATAALEGESTDDPLAVARMQIALGESQRGLGYTEKAIALFTKVRSTRTSLLGPEHPDTLASTNSLAVGYREAGKLDLALPLLEETLALRKLKLGPDHPDTLMSMNNLATAYQAAGRLDRALPLLEETLALRKLKLGPDHPDTLMSMNNLATGFQAAGKLDVALPLYEEALALKKAKLGPEHPDTLISVNNLAEGYRAAGKLDLALPLYEETLARFKAKLGPEHPDTLTSMNNMASAYQSARRLDLALPLYEEALALRKTKLGPEHPDTLQSMNNLATCFQAAGRLDLALPLHEETLALRKLKLGPDHPGTLASMNNLAAGYLTAGKLDRSIPLFEETVRLRAARSGTDHPETWRARANLGVNYKDAGRLAEALPLLEGAFEASRKFQTLRWVRQPLLDAYVQTGLGEKAVALALELLAEGRAASPPAGPQLAGLLAQAGSTLLSVQAWVKAEPILRECLAIREKAEPDAWTTFNTGSMLGAALLGLKKYADAEPLLRSGYEGMKARADKIPPQFRDVRLGEALDRLITLAEATDKPDEAKAWKEERAKLPAAAPNPGTEKK